MFFKSFHSIPLVDGKYVRGYGTGCLICLSLRCRRMEEQKQQGGRLWRR